MSENGEILVSTFNKSLFLSVYPDETISILFGLTSDQDLSLDMHIVILLLPSCLLKTEKFFITYIPDAVSTESSD